MKIHKKIHKHLKRKVHHNRWLIWAIAAAAIAALALVGYIKVSDIGFQDRVLNYSDTNTWKTYRDNRLGFSLDYPYSWAIEAQVDGIEFSNPSKPGEVVNVSVYDKSSEKLIRAGLNNSGEESVVVDSEPGVRITNAITKQAKEDVVLVAHGDKLYVIRGSGTLLNRVLSTIKFN